MVVPGRVQAHKQMLHWADLQWETLRKSVGKHVSDCPREGGRRQEKLGKVSLQRLVLWRSRRFSFPIYSQDQS